MPKVEGIKTNFRVVVDPKHMGDFGWASIGLGLLYGKGEDAEKRAERDTMERCEEIAKDIKRHVDNVSRVYVDYDQEYVCEHCGASWTEFSKVYNGGCCDEDEKNNPDVEETNEQKV